MYLRVKFLFVLTPSPCGHSPYILLRKTQGERLRRIPFSFLFRFYMRSPAMLRDTAGEEDKHEQSPLIIDRAVLAGWTFLVFKIKKAVNRKINSLMQYPKGDLHPHSCNSQRILSPSCLPFHHSGSLRAKNGTRTRDPNLGKVVLYQLSYFRNCECKDKMLFCFCKITARKSNGKFYLRLSRPMEGNFKSCFCCIS